MGYVTGYQKYLDDKIAEEYGKEYLDRINNCARAWKGEFKKEEFVEFMIDWERACGVVLRKATRIIPIIGVDCNGKVFRT